MKRAWMRALVAVGFAAALSLGPMTGLRADDSGVSPTAAAGESAPAGPKAPGKMPQRLKEKLGLSDSQVAQWRQAQQKKAEAMRPLWQQRKDEVKELADKVKAGAGDDAIKPILDQLQSTQDSMDAANKAFRDDLRSFLTPTQQAKVMLWMIGKRRHAMKGGRGGWQKSGANAGSAQAGQQN